MKLTEVLYRQHIARMFKAHWRVQSKRVVHETRAEETLISKGIPVVDAVEFAKIKHPQTQVNIVGYKSKPIPLNETHPNWHDNVCYFYRDNNVLLEGIDQAKIITKTIEVKEGLPVKIQELPKLSKDIDNKIIKIILSSHLFDCQQEKLPKIKDPNRPAFNFPRIYGITQERATSLLTTKLLQLCELISDKNIVRERAIMHDAKFFVPFTKAEELLQLELSTEKLLLSSRPLDIVTNQSTDEVNLPDLYPIKYTVTLIPEHIYQTNNVYPVNKSVLKNHPHTIFVHYNSLKTKNLYEEEVTESQILGRSLMKTFAVAAAYAKQKHGDDVKVLPRPVTLQCVHTDGKKFHFAILQLNTLDLDDGGVKNIWFSLPRISLFDSCEYELGRPVIKGYNPDVMKYLLAFYNNV